VEESNEEVKEEGEVSLVDRNEILKTIVSRKEGLEGCLDEGENEDDKADDVSAK